MDIKPIRVVLIEDNEDDAILVREALGGLERGWFEIVWATDIESGLAQVGSAPADVVLLDLSLPDSRGMDTFTRVHEAKPDTAVVVLTGQGDELLGLEVVRRGAEDYVPKAELTQNRLARAVHYAVERKWNECERRRLEAKLAEVQKLESLAQLAALASHDLKNVLTSILGNVHLGNLELPADSTMREYLLHIEKAAEHGANLCRQMLAFAGRGLGLVPTDLSQIISDSAELLAASVPRSIELRLALGQTVPAVDGDENQIRQILFNLVRNAAEAIGDRPGSIQVRTALDNRAGPSVLLEVSDTGPGVPEELRSKIFDPCFSTRGAGRGLGLAAAQGIARRHSARIELGRIPGGGARFGVFFPISRTWAEHRRARLASQPVPAEAWHASGWVLVVDPDTGVRLLTQRILEQEGFTVECAATADEALEALARLRFDLRAVVVDVGALDLVDPQRSAQVCEAVEGHRVVLCGTNGQKGELRQMLYDGRARQLPKPFHPFELVDRMRALLG